MLMRLESTLQFAIVVAMFLPVSLSAIFDYPGSLDTGSGAVLEWGVAVAILLYIYLHLELFGQYFAERELWWAHKLMLAEIATFICVLIVMSWSKDGAILTLWAYALSTLLMITVAIPAIVLSILIAVPLERYFEKRGADSGS